jgi:hypothetical protein
MEALSYFINSLRFPNRRDYIRMTLGIRNRSKKMSQFWAPHLKLTRAFVNSNLEIVSGDQKIKEVVVLGAGSLLDLDCTTLDSYPHRIRLVDVDPTVKKYNRSLFPQARSAGRYSWQTADVTGVMDSWTAELKKFIRRAPNIYDVCEFFKKLSLVRPQVSITEESCVVSLNLLGQLGVYWRDRALSILKQELGYLDSQGNLKSEIDEAVSWSVKTLEQGHFEMLQAARFVILITDARYYYYRKDTAIWQDEEALTISDVKAKFINQGFAALNFNSWLWHISPQGLGDPDYGEIHEVHAYAFRRF